MTQLECVQKIIISEPLTQKVFSHLEEMGSENLEGVALLAGQLQDKVFVVLETIIPEQTGISTDKGVCFVVKAQELHRLNVWLFENNMTLIAQIHSHPDRAYHSLMDEAYSIMTTEGGFSIVIPNFARKQQDFRMCACYRLTRGKWRLIKQKEVSKLITIRE